MTRLGELIKKRRERDSLSLRDFSEKCNLSHSYIKNLEDCDPRTGKTIVPTIDSLEKIALALDMSLEELLKETGYINSTYQYYHSQYNMCSHVEDKKLEYFINNPESVEYLQLAKDLYERKIKVKFIRNTFFEE